MTDLYKPYITIILNPHLILVVTALMLMQSCSETNQQTKKAEKPNVILVITDDQGYGDIAAHGNPYIITPNLDKLHSESIRLTDFHVSPTCTPSRGALMTGRYTNRTGAWHTIAGWSILREEEKTLANMFSEGGYRTGVFGKWHLGDNYPFRVQDRGFQESVVHGGGGVQQTPDYWGNDYFDDTYFHNGKPQKYKGYCTDVFFDEAIDFIEGSDKPFFCYISTNAPHGPYNVPPSYENMYSKFGDDVLLERQKQFLGMITNVDENLGKLRTKLSELKIADNTILIFMTDNGTAYGYRPVDRKDPKSKYLGYNANMKGAKGSQFDGGHRVPFFIYWKDGNIVGGKDINQLTAHIDVMPTLADLCDLALPKDHLKIDGENLKPLFNGETVDWANRVIVTDSQREQVPMKWRRTAVMQNNWRLVNETKLYNIKEDPGQVNDVAEQNSAVVEKLSVAYDNWWDSVSEDFDEEIYVKVGTAYEEPTVLTTHDWHAANSNQKWNQIQIRQGGYGNGYWTIDVMQEGTYQVSLRRYPKESGLNFGDSPDGYTSKEEPGLNTDVPQGVPAKFVSAKIKVGDTMSTSKPVNLNEQEVVFETTFAKGKTKLWSYMEDDEGEVSGAYYAYIKKL